MDCKDCTHRYVCSILENYGRPQKCKHFKDRSKFVELPHRPFKIGSTVYVLEYEDDIAVDCAGYIVLMANSEYALLSPIVNDMRKPKDLCDHYYQKFYNDDFDYCGNCVIAPINELYNSLEKAEQALEERNADDGKTI